MARTLPSLPEPTSTRGQAAPSATWSDWFWKFQAFQVHAARDVLAVCNQGVTSLASTRDALSLVAASQAVLVDWVACVDGAQHEWLALAKAVPEDALAALGWRLRPGVRRVGVEPHAGVPDLFEQSRLGVEMLLRPWMPVPGLDHTDEFVA
ncbi:MAG: hypothetical protein JF586_01925 [Burkholderiales bacterium]|jgi:hypothetical protein|nr:hypothetical protein [Burkholderiales bacterium]